MKTNLMAEIITSGPSSKRKGSASLHIDMTPLVDLGFLLITFFIFTTTLGEPMALKLYMPADGPSTPQAASAALTVLLDNDNRIYYYEGQWEEAVAQKRVHLTNYTMQGGLGQVIRQKQKALGSKKEQLNLMIKPLDESTYSNVINTLDEVKINALKHYALMEATQEEKAFVAQKRGS